MIPCRSGVRSDLRMLLLALAAAVLPSSSAHASLTGLGDVASPIPELSTVLPRELPGPCEGELCGELEAPQPKTRVRGFELDLSCRLGGEQGLSCAPRRVYGVEYGERTSDRSVFTGHYFDTETQLYYAKARYFDPELGRFLSQDSYLGELTEPPSLHRYLYAHGNPTRYVDPDGHRPRPRSVVTPEGYTVPIPEGDYVEVHADPIKQLEYEVESGQRSVSSAVSSGTGRLVRGVNKLGNTGVRVVGVGAQATAAVGLAMLPEPSSKAGAAYFGLRAADEGQALVRELWTGQPTASEAHQGLQIVFEATGSKQDDASFYASMTLLGADASVGGLSGYGATRGRRQPAAQTRARAQRVIEDSSQGGEFEGDLRMVDQPLQQPTPLRGTNEPGKVTSRGSWRKQTTQDAWDSAEPSPTGGRLCPTCSDEVKVPPSTEQPRDWDIDHDPAWTNREFPPNVTRQEVLDNYQDGTRLECPTCNRGRGNRDATRKP